MLCAKCKTTQLAPTKLEQGFSAMGCETCRGAFVSLLYYRDWVESKPMVSDVPSDFSAEKDAVDTTTAMGCPKCQKIMSKFRISGGTVNRLDLCNTCEEAWLDGGEWELLKLLELSHDMPEVFTQAWQLRVKQDEVEASRELWLAKFLNQHDIDQARRIKKWLNEHPNKTEIIQYFTTK